MAETQEKRRYWLKLEKDFLDSKYIKIIKDMKNGNDYILFYIALMLASVESVGHLRFTELVPYNEQMLASLTGTNIDTVRSAMKLFEELGMINILSDGTIFIPDVPRLTGKESESAERVRLYRERKKALQCNGDVTNCNDNKEKDEEKDKQRTNNNEQEQAFIAFWKSYPKKKSKGTAEKAWAKINPSLHDTIMASLEKHKQSADWLKEGGQFIPYPATWLNAKGWEDEIDDKIFKKHAGSKEAYSVDMSGYETL
jgi:predicted phage replisome organizer